MNTEVADGAVIGTRRTGLMVYATLCAGLVGLLFLTNWPSYQYAVRGGPIPLYFYALPAVLIIPMVFAEPAAAIRHMREPMFWWFVVFVMSGLLWLLIAQDVLEDASRQWRLRVLAFLFFYTTALLAGEAQQRVIGWVIIACVLIACAFNWFDVLRPFRFVPQGVEGAQDGRGAGLFINPNGAGAFIVMGTIAALPLVPVRFRALFLITAVFGVAATFSRGAFVMVTVAMLGAVWFKLVRRVQGVLLIVALPLLVAGISVSYDYIIDKSENRHMLNIVQRLNWFQEMDEEDFAVEGRRYGARLAWQIFLDNPLTGKGPGATSGAMQQEGPHNMYLLFMAEQGFLGLLLYVSLIGIMLRSGRRLAARARNLYERDVGNTQILFGIFMATYGFFSHNALEDPFTVFLLGFVVTAGFNCMRGLTAERAHMGIRPVARRATPAVR